MPSPRLPTARPDASRQRSGTGRTASRDGDWHTVSRSPADTDRIGRLIGRALEGGEVVGLYGALGTGKTVLVRGIAAGLGAPPRAVSSPTFVLVHVYAGRLPLAHADLFRIQSETELRHVGLLDYSDTRTATAIEWAERAGAELPDDRLEIHLDHRGRQSRAMTLKAKGARSRRLLARVLSLQAAEEAKTGGKRAR